MTYQQAFLVCFHALILLSRDLALAEDIDAALIINRVLAKAFCDAYTKNTDELLDCIRDANIAEFGLFIKKINHRNEDIIL